VIESIIDRIEYKPILEGFIPIVPQPKQSARFFAMKGKNGKHSVRSYTDKKKKSYVLDLSQMIIYFGEETKEPLKFTGLFCFPFNKTQRKADLEREFCLHSVKPDTDNLLKPFFDALEGKLYKNDSQICQHEVMKIRSKDFGIYYKFEEISYK
jgi:Holliday junction resolvase RusA-like endonuclease